MRLRILIIVLLGLMLLANPAWSQTTCKEDVVWGPYTISGAQQYEVKSITVTIYSQGNVIATYTFSILLNGVGTTQIKLNNQPYTQDPSFNPLGLYTPADANALKLSLCPDSVPIFTPDLRARATVGVSPAPVYGQAASQFVSADFNGDGVPDNASAGPGFVQVTLYNANGTAQSPKTYPIAGKYMGSVVAADFNGDGVPDLAVSIVTDNPPGSVAVLLGKGDGTFSPAVNYSAGPSPLAIASTDLNGDGKIDLVIANTSATGFPSGSVAVLIGKGDGTFAAPVIYNAGTIPVSLVATDLNGDGKPDIAVLDAPGGPAYDQLLVLLSNGDGTLRTPLPAFSTKTNLGSLTFTDLNHDGKMDLLIADRRSSDLTVTMGKGDGTFQPPAAYVSAAQPQSAAILPLNDGTTAVLTSDSISGAVLVTVANADGTVNAPPIQALGNSPSAVAVADLNGDRKPDVIVTDQGGNQVFVMVNSGNYAFAAPVSYALSSPPTATAAVDVNGDAKPDLVVADANGVDILLNSGNGAFGKPTTISVSGSTSGVAGPAVADFDGDGKPDIALFTSNGVNMLQGQGNGTFSAGNSIAVSGNISPIGLLAGDFNGDGKPDLAFAYILQNADFTVSGFLEIALGNGKGTFQTSTIPVAGSPASLAAGDLNKDGVLDLVAGLQTSTGYKVVVLLGKGDGTFRTPLTNNTATSTRTITIADLDGDGNPDLVLGDCCGLAEASAMVGNGDGTFQAENVFPSGPNPGYLAAGDFDGDGKPDLAIAGAGNGRGTLLLLHNINPGVGKAAVLSAANPSATAIAPNSLATAYGTDLANIAPAATSLPLPPTFGGTSVSIKDSSGASTPAPLVYVSASQVNFLVPSGVATGPATVTITSGDGRQSIASVTIASVAPGVFVLNSGNLAAAIGLLFAPDGSYTVDPVYAVNSSGSVVAQPLSLGPSSDQFVLSIYGTGIRAAGTSGVSVTIGGVPCRFNMRETKAVFRGSIR